jgi:uncharacterized protein (TIGR02246 family)
VGVAKPEEMNAAFAEAYNSGDIEQLLALYEPGALLAPLPGRRARGEAAIREALLGLLALKGQMSSVNNYCMQVGDLALLQGEWQLSGTGPTGEPIEQRSRTAEVVRRQADGLWLYVIDHPYADDGDAS